MEAGGERNAKAAFDFPECVLPCLLPHLAKDLRTLLAVCCVAREWRDVVTTTPSLWKRVCIPGNLRRKIIDEHLEQLLRYTGGHGLVSIDISHCYRLTDRSAQLIAENLTKVPEIVDISDCQGITWKGCILLAQQLLKVLRAKRVQRRSTEDGGEVSMSVLLPIALAELFS